MTSPLNPVRPSAEGREICLLPRHWAWLAAQPRSASATLRALVEHASRDADGQIASRTAQEACHAFMHDHAGDRPNFEEACRALFARKQAAFEALITIWPEEIQQQLRTMAAPIWPTIQDPNGRQ